MVKKEFDKWWNSWKAVPEELTVRHTGKIPDPGGTWKIKNLLYIAFVQGYKLGKMGGKNV